MGRDGIGRDQLEQPCLSRFRDLREAPREGIRGPSETDRDRGVQGVMTNRSRVAVTVATALVLGASAYLDAVDASLPGVVQDIWDHGSWMIDGLAIIGVFLVYRWWALLPAIAPAAVMIYLQSMTDYVEPWHGDAIGTIDFSGQPVLYVLLAIVGTALRAAVLSVGLLLRRAWERVRSERSGGSLPDSA